MADSFHNSLQTIYIDLMQTYLPTPHYKMHVIYHNGEAPKIQKNQSRYIIWNEFHRDKLTEQTWNNKSK